MENKNKTYRALLFTVIVLLGTIAAAIIHRNVWFEYESAQAVTEHVAETKVNSSTGADVPSDIGIDDGKNSVVVFTKPEGSGLENGIYYRRFSADGTAKDENDIQVNTSKDGNQTSPAVAMDREGNFVVAWTSNHDTETGYDIYLQAYISDGTPAGSEMLVNTTTANDQNNPDIAIDYDGPTSPEKFVVSWDSSNGTDTDVMFQEYEINFDAPSGAARVGVETTANTTTENDQKNNAVAMNNLGEIIVAWFGDNGSGNHVMYQIYSQNLTPAGSNTDVHTAMGTADIHPSVAADKKSRSSLNDTEDITFVIAYEDHISANENGIAVKRTNCIDPNGTNNDDSDLSCSLNAVKSIANDNLTATISNPDVAADYLGNYLVTWQDTSADGHDDGIAAQGYNFRGHRTSRENFNVNSINSEGAQNNPSVAMNTEGFYNITFKNNNNSSFYFKTYVTEIFKLNNEFRPNLPSDSTQANIATDVSPGGNQVFVWKDSADNSIRFSLYTTDRSNPSNPIIRLVNNGAIDIQNIRVDNHTPFSINSDNPDVSFFKDATHSNKFIIVWEADIGDGKNIYYQIFGENGDPIGTSPVLVNFESAGNQINPSVSAGHYTDDEFTVAWIDQSSDDIDSAYHTASSGFYYTKIKDCTTGSGTCTDVSTSLNPSNNYAVFAYQVNNGAASDIYIQQTINGSPQGDATEVYPPSNSNKSPDIKFISDKDFAVVYVKNDTSTKINTSEFTFNPTGNPALLGEFEVSKSDNPATVSSPKIGASIINEEENQYYLVAWASNYPDFTSYDIYGQFLDYSADSGMSDRFGPNFTINSTINGDQYVPDVAYNEFGMGTVAWEGATSADLNGIGAQTLQNPQISEGAAPVIPTLVQEITTGGLTLDLPSTISFPVIEASATESQTQTISIRNETYGGDVKYIEIQDALGSDFSLTVQISDFTIEETGPEGTVQEPKAYIMNEEHFKIRNWDKNILNVNEGCTLETPGKCFLTINSSLSPAKTNFRLHEDTETKTPINKSTPLAEKKNPGHELEIGSWRFYPDFEITIPPFTPGGLHEATMTFTLI